MVDEPGFVARESNSNKSVALIGFWAAILTAVFTAVSFAIAVTTLPRSGPYCTGDCVTYPYTDVAEFIPRDYLWLYPATFVPLLFVVLMISIHYFAPEHKKILSHVAVSFALISSVVFITDFFIQLAVMQPAFLKGEIEGLSPFSQYNPHGIYIALEVLGFLMMSAAFVFAAGVFTRKGLERVIRWLFIISFVLAIVGFVVYSLMYGRDLDYRFEVFIYAINWPVLIVASILLSIIFRRMERKRPL
ncbi:MAG: hypothetical protein ACYC57_10390 [Thermoleophilia bacterium]